MLLRRGPQSELLSFGSLAVAWAVNAAFPGVRAVYGGIILYLPLCLGRTPMFERNPVDAGRMMAVAVTVTLKDGTEATGKTAMPHGRSIARLMEGPEAFLYLETFEGGTAFVPKSEIRGLKVVDTGRPQPLQTHVGDATYFDPHKVLGLERSATGEDIKAAYLAHTRRYHPDQYAAVTLPPEVTAYIGERCKQINAAFEILKARPKARSLG